MGLGIPPLRIEIKLESNPLKSIMLVRRLAVMPEQWARGMHVARRRRLEDVARDGAGGLLITDKWGQR